MSDLTATSTSNTITLTWIEPNPIPSNGYNITRQCRRLCEVSFNDFMQNTSSSSPLVFSGNPGGQCTISFMGRFGTDIIEFDSGIIVITLSVGEFDKLMMLIICILIFLSQNLPLLQRTLSSH